MSSSARLYCKLRSKRIVVAFAALAGASLVLAGHLAQRLYVDGTVASTDLKVIGGRTYAPVGDIAKALGYQVVKRAGGIELVKAGGANQIGNRNTGKLGEEIFTGKWRFIVSKAERVKSYKVIDNDYIYVTNRNVGAKDDEDLIVLTCRIKNGTPNRDEIVFSPTWDGIHTALTDGNENSYIADTFDLKATENAPIGAIFNPGAAINFRVVFRIPTSAHPKDFIFTALRYSMRDSTGMKNEPPQDIRISLGVL